MALSFCCNWDSPQLLPDLTADLFDFSNNHFGLSEAYFNPLFGSHDYSYLENYTTPFPCFSTPTDNNDIMKSLTHAPEAEIFPFPLDDLESYQYPKRQKSSANHYDSNLMPSMYDGDVVPNPIPFPEFVPEVEVQSSYCCGNLQKLNNGVSAQSIAARERRRKITEKTQELGKLIPGATKMNTAQMFQAASKYVRFLQAQVGILQLMQESKEALNTEQLQVLVVSPIMQEKLYSEEKCLVPIQLAKDTN